MGVNRLATSPAPRDITGGWSAVGESDDVVLVFDFSDSGGAATLTPSLLAHQNQGRRV